MLTKVPTGWTFRSVATAAGLSIAGMMLLLQLMRWELWPQGGWSFLLVPAVASSIWLAMHHPGTKLLTAFVFLPVLVVVMFYAAACLPLAPP